MFKSLAVKHGGHFRAILFSLTLFIFQERNNFIHKIKVYISIDISEFIASHVCRIFY